MTITRADTHSSRRRRAAITAALALSALLLALIAPAAARAATLWREGAEGSPFHLASTGGTVIGGSPSDQSITLPFAVAWTAPSSVAPWSVVPMGDGTMLVAEPDANSVRIVDKSGIRSVVADASDASIGLTRPLWAARAGDNFLIADPNKDRIVEVNAVREIVRKFDAASSGLSQPRSAVRVGTDTTLIADMGNDRVIEVGPDGVRLGQYGHTGVVGTGTNYLNGPQCAIRLTNGSTIIADTLNNRLVIIGAFDPPQTPTVIGSSVLNQPTSVFQTDSSTLLVADTGNNRVVEMDLGGRILTVMNAGLSAPTGAASLSDGSTAIAYGPSGSRLLQGQGPGGNSGSAVSSPLDFGLPGVTKKLNSIAWNVSGTGVALSYRLNGSKTWKPFPKGGVFSPVASFTILEYKVTLTGSGAGVPTLNELSFNWDYVPPPTATGGTPFGTGTGLGTGFGTGTGFGAGGSYTGTGTAIPEVIFDNGVRRGWVMENVGGFGTGKLPGPGGVAAQPLTKKQAAGLALLGGMWGIGIALQPIGKLLLALRGMIPFGIISGR